MLKKILSRGGPAAGYLVIRFFKSVTLLAALPVSLIWGWLIPGATAGLVRLANSERYRAAKYLGLPQAEELPPALPRAPGDVVTLFRDTSFKRSLRCLLMPVVMIPELFVAAVSVIGAPAAVAGMLLWKLDPGNFSLMGVGVSNWFEALTLGPLQIGASLWFLGRVAPALARGHARTVLTALAPTQEQLETARLEQRVEELTKSRAGAVDSHGAELRRIERDLHDGTQAQLVSLAMRIGIAKQTMANDPEKAAKLLDDARDGAEQAMTELRGVLRTMYPPILADRGLAGAVSALAARCPLPVELRIGELGEVPAAVEAAAYFVVAESLTNITKHSAAGHVDIQLERREAELYLAVTDDGIGGARVNEQSDLLGRGSGLHGMLHRVQAIDGHLELNSPIGGPTTVEVILPCG
ncbi:signal transduction histidine kinase [Kribbella sp. VKM Ac-2571]|uniref:sensor histidine kinase n=1 Tax=Kribbella sp. VKM Ac-2571 TaxID=2512222 RepID=UPI001061F26C|nr:histidine kinase [Kribbella sp. VKM Ac-2571]TDO54081.1 signal transduction histidine kinase [Kribbella sp. VKM Ac-2571]